MLTEKDRVKEIQELRKVMGTIPDANPEIQTLYHGGVNGIKVELIDWSQNPYRAMFTVATSTWGKKIDKWNDVSPEGRLMVVKAVLSGSTLPTALEAVQFVFGIEGVSRSSFDQTARARIGAGFGSMGVRDNNHCDASIRIPNEILDDPELINEFIHNMEQMKQLYHTIISRGQKSWQTARAVMPMSMEHRFSAIFNLMALKGYCARRCCFGEQEDTVATAWLMRAAVYARFPLIGTYLRPACDNTHKCLYHKAYTLSELFGCLFAACGRNPSDADYNYSEFNGACTDIDDLEEQLDLCIPRPGDYEIFESLADLYESDYKLIMEDV